jgi:NRPS condensation-like uncharacterized protein
MIGGNMKSNMPHRFPATALDCYVDYLAGSLGLMIQLEMEFDEGLDAARLEKAIDLVLDAEPVLGCRFVDDSYKPYFERLGVNRHSAFRLANTANEYETFKSTPMDHRTGPQIKVCLWHSPAGDRLLLKVSHQVADAGGVKDIAAVLSSTYNRLSKDPAYVPPSNTREHRGLWQVVRHVPVQAYPRVFLNSVKYVMLMYSRQTVHTVAVADGPRELLTYVARLVPSMRVSALAEYGRAHNATLNDVFLAASVRSLVNTAQWDRRSHLSLNTTLDMRRYIPSGRAEAVANLSTDLIHCPDLGTELGHDFQTTLDRVARIMRHGKTHWLGPELAVVPSTLLTKILPHRWGVKVADRWVRLRLKRHVGGHGFTNTGPINPESVTFGMRPSKAHILPPQDYPPMPFVYSLSGYNGTLTLLAGAYPTQKETIERFFDAVVKELPV